MNPQTYHLEIDWRRAKFFTSHPQIMPACSDPVTVPEHSLFLHLEDIGDVITIRDWLYASDLRYRLLGCYERFTSLFRGIVFVFDKLADVALFRRQWAPVMA